MSAASDQISYARLVLLNRRPYLAQVAMALQPVEVEGLMDKYGCSGPISVDQYWRMYYDPVWIVDAKLWPSLLHLATAICHEVAHLLRHHAQRCVTIQANPLGWNLAGDREINDDLAAEKDMALPAWALVPGNYPPWMKDWPDGELAEEYYWRMVKQAEEQQGAGSECGSCAHGVAQPWEQGAPDRKNAPGITKVDAQLIREQTAKAVAAAAKSCGTVPGWLQRWAKDILHVQVDPEKLFRGLVRRTLATARGMTDYSYAAPARRAAALHGVILPTMRRPELRPLIIVDTSQSMSDGRDLALALGLVHRVLTSLGHTAAIPVLSCDAAVHTVERVTSVRQIHLVGGGGTDMGEGLLRAAEWRPRPDVCVVVTDGATPWPLAPLPFPVVVALTQQAEGVPAWARSVVLTTAQDSPTAP